VTAEPSADVPFVKGDAEATTQANGLDSDYGDYVTVGDVTTVALTKV
jgi:hypothetical protein